MGDILAELARTSEAYDQPTLTLLHRRDARIVLAIFRSCFTRDQRTLPTARLHEMVQTHLDQLRQEGVENLPNGTGRDLCMRWVRHSWLVRDVEDGQEVYTLTSHTQEALNLVTALTRERISLSEHRIGTIVTAIRKFNAQVNPDRAQRIRILEDQIAALSAERDRLAGGGEMVQASEHTLRQGFDEVLGLVSALPRDFARVEESYARLRADILAAFRTEELTGGQIIDRYLSQTRQLMTATPEGKAFEGALALLTDADLMSQLRQDITALLEHPLAETILSPGERTDLRGTVKLISDSTQQVLDNRTRAATTLRDYINTRDASHDRELDDTLRKLEAEAATWMTHARPRENVPLTLLPGRTQVGHLRERLYDPDTAAPPPPLADTGEADESEVTLEELRGLGGPSLPQLAQRLSEALAGGTRQDLTLGAVFDQLPEDLRRPVEVIGLLHLATPHLVQAHGEEIYRTRRTDGTTRTLAAPRLHLTPTEETP